MDIKYTNFTTNEFIICNGVICTKNQIVLEIFELKNTIMMIFIYLKRRQN